VLGLTALFVLGLRMLIRINFLFFFGLVRHILLSGENGENQDKKHKTMFKSEVVIGLLFN
jgi:hypothetical protein